MKSEIQKIFNKISTEIGPLVESHSALTKNSPVYAGSFWLFYCDYTVIHPPCFALNTVDGIELDDGWSNKWSPPDWKFPSIDDVTESLMPLYLELSELLKDQSDDIWEEVIDYNFRLYCNLCRKLTINARGNFGEYSQWNKTEDFLFLIIEEREGEEMYNQLLKDSVESRTLKKLDGIVVE